MSAKLFSRADREQMKRLGISEAAALRQLAIFTEGPSRLTLQRPCTLGDGIITLKADDHERLLSRWNDAADQGRLSEFIPASGAATRMFAFVERVWKQSGGFNSTGATHGQEIIEFMTTFPPMDDLIDCKIAQQWVLLGDPSLKIGGYSS